MCCGSDVHTNIPLQHTKLGLHTHESPASMLQWTSPHLATWQSMVHTPEAFCWPPAAALTAVEDRVCAPAPRWPWSPKITSAYTAKAPAICLLQNSSRSCLGSQLQPQPGKCLHVYLVLCVQFSPVPQRGEVGWRGAGAITGCIMLNMLA